MEKKALQWHPAFYAGLQIELQEEKDNLIFENEHQLGTKPKEIDVLIIKKEKDIPIKKNIGRIFRKHNIIEYKSPTDYLSIDDFYKVLAYAYLYKIDTVNENEISIEDITISFVCKGYPRSLVKHLREVWGYQVEQKDAGIYYIQTGWQNGVLPMQILVTKKLNPEENLWLSSLTDKLPPEIEANRLVNEYQNHRQNKLYESVMDVVVRANVEEFEEIRSMCKALEELMADVIEERVKEKVEERVAVRVEEEVAVRVEEEVAVRLAEAEEQVAKEATRQATAQEIENGIKVLIETCHELGVGKEDTLSKVMEKYNKSEEETQKYMLKYWK